MTVRIDGDGEMHVVNHQEGSFNRLMELLDNLGTQGWELVSPNHAQQGDGAAVMCFLKRRRSSTSGDVYWRWGAAMVTDGQTLRRRPVRPAGDRGPTQIGSNPSEAMPDEVSLIAEPRRRSQSHRKQIAKSERSLIDS